MTLQTSTALNRLVLDGYVETVRHASAAIAAMVRSLQVADHTMVKSVCPTPDVSGSAVAGMASAVLQDIMRKDEDPVAGAAPTGRRRQSPSR